MDHHFPLPKRGKARNVNKVKNGATKNKVENKVKNKVGTSLAPRTSVRASRATGPDESEPNRRPLALTCFVRGTWSWSTFSSATEYYKASPARGAKRVVRAN